MQGETIHNHPSGDITASISIHSPYAGRDRYQTEQVILQIEFQSTLPMQGETLKYPSKKAKK